MADPIRYTVHKNRPVAPEDEICITGISGRFPDSNNMDELKENLFAKRDLISGDDRRWKLDHPEIPQRTGKINNPGKFDATFFGVHFKQAHTMDPMCRMLLEHAFEAIVDAGYNPRSLRGTKLGVFIGACFSESEKTWFYEKIQVNGYGITGCSRAMLANRISYWLGVSGPSYTVDSACSSSLFAIEHAYRAIKDGLCDAAIVGGSNLALHPYVSLQFSRLGVLSMDGCCKSFDADANGYARSEAVVVIFLQKAKDSRRVYAKVVHAKTNCDGFKEQGITFPSSIMQGRLLKEFYYECGIPSNSLSFIEAHGTGTKVGDPEEVNAIDNVLCAGRTTPLLMGSVKSNLGHSEPASGLCSVAKMVIANETGFLLPNLHYKRPREGVKALEEGRLKVVTEVTPWDGGLVGINSFGFGGANAHVLLKTHDKNKVNGGAPTDDLPRLGIASSRTMEGVRALLDDMESRPVDAEYFRLIYDIFAENVSGHIYRGYTIVGGKNRTEQIINEVKEYPGAQRPVVFVYPGMGSQWNRMGTDLLNIPVFAKAVEKCDKVLRPEGLDIYNILTSQDPKLFDNILHCFAGIATVQIGLTDVLKSIGVSADMILGHSVGELGCAYADGALTAEQMVMIAYYRGKSSLETKVIHGAMAAVGLTPDDLKKILPADIDISCYNSADNCTISGPNASVKAFIKKLEASSIFAREVNSGEIAYHSRYITEVGKALLKYITPLIPTPKERSHKWISSSVPKANWNTPEARMNSANYHVRNLLSPVLFDQASKSIPSDAIVIEIAPHGILQAILKRSLGPRVTNIPLTNRRQKNQLECLLKGVGQMYMAGMHPVVADLYPPIQYPVSRGTRMISPLIKWEHTDDWYVTSYRMQDKITSGERTVQVCLSDENFEFMAGHVIDGRLLLPATGYLALIWETVGMMKGDLYTEFSVVFEDVKFLRATNIPKEGEIELTLMVQKGTGRFEVVENGSAVVTGIVRTTKNASAERIDVDDLPENNDEEEMTTRDVYKELRLRGYHYSGIFRGIKSCTLDGTKGHIGWDNNWVAFMDNMLQMVILTKDTRGLFVPTGIQKLVIDTKHHMSQFRAMPDDKKEFPVRVITEAEVISAGGVEIRGLKASAIARRKPAGEPVLEEYKFMGHRDLKELTPIEVVRSTLHIAQENHATIKIKTLECINEGDHMENILSPLILEALGDLPLMQADVNIVSENYTGPELPPTVNVIEPKKLTLDTNAMIAYGQNLLTKQKQHILRQLTIAVEEAGFLVSRENTQSGSALHKSAESSGLKVVMEKKMGNEIVVLLRKHSKAKKSVVIVVNNNKFDWLNELKKNLKNETEKDAVVSSKIIVVGHGFESGVLGFVNCIRKEPGGELVRGVLIQDPKAPEFSLQNPLYAEQLQLDLATNVLRPGGVWGSYRHLLMKPLEPREVPHAYVNQIVKGDLSTLKWLEGPLSPKIKNPDLVYVVYSSINFRDIMLSTGKLATEVGAKHRLAQDCVIGFEYCGIDVSGRRIMGMSDCRCMTNLLIADRSLAWEFPDDWSLDDAATVPCVYGTCYAALYMKGKMKKGDSILIHAGTGGIGQAAITLALYEGCEVFTTVGTPEKRKFIKERFPQIQDDHIGNSRDTSFEQMIMRMTKGRGVDMVLNSLAEEKLQASVRCLAHGGRFLEIGKFDLAANNPLGLQAFLKEISFHGVMVDSLFDAPTEVKKKFKDLVSTGLNIGAIKPLTRTIFTKDELENAFRYMAAGKHVGKVIIKVRDENEPLDTTISALPVFHCLADCSYIILGGLGGFGLELADWMVIRGCRKLVLTSRTGFRNGYQKMRVKIWKSYGAQVVVVAGKDPSKEEDCKDILKAASDMGPIDGVFNLAVVLKDSIWENQTEETFEESFRGKAWATKMLDKLTRKLCPQLRYFVVFSSVSCGRGNAGQTNYGMSNSVMERICEERRADGLSALAVQWGTIGDVGLVAEMQEDHRELVIAGTLQQRISSCIQELDHFLRSDCTIVSSMVVAEKRAGGAGATDMVDTVLNIMGLKDLKTVSKHTSLAELGMDSMMAVEIKQTLEREFEIFLTAQDIRNLNFAKLQEMAVKEAENAKKTDQAPVEVLTGMKLLVRTVGWKGASSDVCVKLPTKCEENKEEVFLIPGIEGLSTVFANLAPQLKSPATCLQPHWKNMQNPTIADVADSLLPEVLKKLNGRRDFVIMGYSYGSIIAIELARRLEANGCLGRLVLVDGAPHMMRAFKDSQLPVSTVEELQDYMLVGIMDLLVPTASQSLLTDLEKCKSFDEKLDVFIKNLPEGTTGMSTESQRDLLTSIYKRLLTIENHDYQSLPPIRSPILLIKPTQTSIKQIEEDYGLKQITRDRVDIYYTEGNHMTVLDNPKVASAIDGDPLEDADEFKARILTVGDVKSTANDRL